MTEPLIQGWHLNKQVPIAIILALFLQFASGVWIFSEMRSDIDENAREIVRESATRMRDIARIETALSAVAASSQTQAIQLGRIEAGFADMRADIAALVTMLKDDRAPR